MPTGMSMSTVAAGSPALREATQAGARVVDGDGVAGRAGDGGGGQPVVGLVDGLHREAAVRLEFVGGGAAGVRFSSGPVPGVPARASASAGSE